MSNTDDMLYEQCKCISEELDELVDKYNNSDDCDDFIEILTIIMELTIYGVWV